MVVLLVFGWVGFVWVLGVVVGRVFMCCWVGLVFSWLGWAGCLFEGYGVYVIVYIYLLMLGWWVWWCGDCVGEVCL